MNMKLIPHTCIHAFSHTCLCVFFCSTIKVKLFFLSFSRYYEDRYRERDRDRDRDRERETSRREPERERDRDRERAESSHRSSRH